MLLDPLYIVMMAPVIMLVIWAQYKVKSTFEKFSRVGTQRGMSGAEAAQRILSQEGLSDVRVELVDGWLSDHYDPKAKVLRLSPGVYNGRSVSAVGVAAHEVGHAIQDAHGYAMMSLRTVMAPTASIGSWLGPLVIILGMLLQSMGMIKIGIVIFSVIAVFQLVTLPVEFNASSRAKAALLTTGILSNEAESEGVRKVLSAAAMTYVAAMIATLMELLYWIMQVNRRD